MSPISEQDHWTIIIVVLYINHMKTYNFPIFGVVLLFSYDLTGLCLWVNYGVEPIWLTPD